MNSKEREVCEYLEERSSEIIELLQKMVLQKSVNPPGDTTAVASVIAEKLDSYQIPYKEIVVKDIHKSIISTIGEGEKNLLFNAHMDTVPIGDLNKWTVDPFNEPLHGDILYGRGSADDKGGVAAMVMAICALKSCGIKLNGRMTINPVADEETGGENGVKYLLDNNYINPDMVVVGEITENNVAIAHKGLIWFKIVAKGKTAHASSPWDGVNAISKMIKFVNRLERYYEIELPKRTDPLTSSATYNIGAIEGGVKANVVADSCTVILDRRILADETLQDNVDELQDMVDQFMRDEPNADISFEVINYSPSLKTSPDELLVKKSLEVVSEFGRNTNPVGYQQSCDGRYFSNRGIPTVVLGPGIASEAHTPDESINVNDVLECAKIYALLAMRILGYKDLLELL